MREGDIYLNLEKKDVIKRDGDVFYNPFMRHNRDISLAILQTFRPTKIALPLEGSGVRGARILKLAENSNHSKTRISLNVSNQPIQSNQTLVKKVEANTTDWNPQVYFNDINPKAVLKTKEVLSENNLAVHICNVSQFDANVFLRTQKWDYIDIDPFGSPNPFLDSAIVQLKRNGILAVTATDTAPLCGTYPKACLRKYWATNSKHYMCQELGLRILIRKVQLVGAQYDKALTPIFSYSKDHYMRVYFKVTVGKEAVDLLLGLHNIVFADKYRVSLEKFQTTDAKGLKEIGPLYTGNLFDVPLDFFAIAKSLAKTKAEEKWIDTIQIEASKNIFGYYHVHTLAELLKIEKLPPLNERLGIRTIFNPESVRTTLSFEEFCRRIQIGKNRFSDE
jgi:tRNA (guanine26-N2/guanine27-N2)-dimethyltransferase